MVDQRSHTNWQAIGDLVLAALSIGGAAILFIGASTLPPPRFEPMGSAAVPQILGIILILLSLAVAWPAMRSLASARPGDAPSVAPGQTGMTSYRGIILLAILIAYVGALDFLQFPFVPATTVFVMLAGASLRRFDIRTLLTYALLGLVLSSLLSYIFSNFLYIEIG